MQSRSFASHLLGGVAAVALTLAFAPLAAPATAAPAAPLTQPLVVGAPDFSALVAKVAPAVVAIAVTQEPRPNIESAGAPPELRGTPLERRFGRHGRETPAQRVRALGSGFIIDTDGYIVTNNHVVARAREVMVVLSDGRELPAKVVGVDARTDLALLKVDAGKPLTAVALGDSDKILTGQWVVAVGNPFGLGGTVTAGILSARGRAIGGGVYDDYLQIDAPINQGNSGGPSFDIAGNVIGVNTAIYSPTGGSVGVGFAIPSNQVRQIVAELRAHGRVERGWLGTSLQDVSPSMATALGLPEAKGALIVDLDPAGPAAKAGIRRGDVVLNVDGGAIDDSRALARRIAALPRGTRVDVAVWRDGKRQALPVSIGRAQEQRATAEDRPGEAAGRPPIGLSLAPAQGRPGAVVVDVKADSPADRGGFRPGDVIVEIDRAAVDSPADAIEKLGAIRGQRKSAAAVLVERNGHNLYLGLTFDAPTG